MPKLDDALGLHADDAPTERYVKIEFLDGGVIDIKMVGLSFMELVMAQWQIGWEANRAKMTQERAMPPALIRTPDKALPRLIRPPAGARVREPRES